MTNGAIVTPLPKTTQDLIDQRRHPFAKSFNDYVDEIFVKHWEDCDFMRFIEGTSDSDCVEGSISCDDHEAATRLREYARKEKSHFGSKNIHVWKLALKLVMRRCKVARKERRLTVHGEVVQEAAE